MSLAYCHFLLKNCESLNQLQQIHAQVITQGLLPHLQPLSCKFLNAYSKFGKPTCAHQVFNQIPNPDVISRTSLMSLHLQNNQPHQAIQVFSQITLSGLRLDGFSVVGALSASGWVKDLGLGRLFHGIVYRHELGNETVVNNALIDFYCRNWRIETAQLVFSRMGTRDVISWSSMLNGLVKCQSIESAHQLFEKMPRRETISWTVMITGYVKDRRPMWALELFYQMLSEAHLPTLITLVAVLSACADVGAFDLGRSIHGYVTKTSATSDVTICNALIDMYSKSGSLETGKGIFNWMLNKDVYTWTTMISGFAVHGDGQRAIQVFGDMLKSGEIPNEVTFLSILLACSHSGLIHEGQKWFHVMCKLYNYKPRVEHYGCMVDLLSRSGLLSEARNLIEGMGVDPDAVIWRSLLSACLVHGNTELAEIAGKQIIELEPDDDGVHVLLWNIYASSGRWEAALEMRKTMKNRRITKKPGCSWIEVNGSVHEFLVEDKTHCGQSDIYSLLDGIAKQMKIDCSHHLNQI